MLIVTVDLIKPWDQARRVDLAKDFTSKDRR